MLREILRQAITKIKLQTETDGCRSKRHQSRTKYRMTLKRWSSSKKSRFNNWTGNLLMLCVERTKLWVRLSMTLSITYYTSGRLFQKEKRVHRHQTAVDTLHHQAVGKILPRTPAESPPTMKVMKIHRIPNSCGRRRLEGAT